MAGLMGTGTAGYAGDSQEYGAGYGTGEQMGGMYEPSGNGAGLMSFAASPEGQMALGTMRNLMNQWAMTLHQRQKDTIDYTKALSGNRVPPTTGGNVGPAAVHGFNPAMLMQIIQMMGGGARG